MTLTIPSEAKKPLIWFDLNCPLFFDSYKLEGVDPSNPDDNVIYFELNGADFITALSAYKKSAIIVVIKLAKEEFPFFLINMKIHSGADSVKFVEVSNQVPVIIMPRIGWESVYLPYGEIPFDAQAVCPRFSIFRRFIDTYKYAHNIRITLRQNKSLSIEANSDIAKHVQIFNNIKVMNYADETPYRGGPVTAIVEQKKISNWLHSLAFQTRIELHCLIEQNRKMKLFFRLRDDIMASLVLSAEYEEDSDLSDNEIGPSDQE